MYVAPKGRITPAYAGKTRQSQTLMLQCQDHPRIRGKDESGKLRNWQLLGSPPHTRERLYWTTYGRLHARITPAYAGKTLTALQQSGRTQDHPRIRGKDIERRPVVAAAVGSPPHTRERHPPSILRHLSFRITPAYAGKTIYGYSDIVLPRDHPRIRGKDQCTELTTTSKSGSPPHTRERLNYAH